MLDAIKQFTDDNFSFRKIAHRCIVCVTQSNWMKMWFVPFLVLPGSAEAQGGAIKCLLIAYFIGNISAKKYQNPFMCVKVIASQRWNVFRRHGVDPWKFITKWSLYGMSSFHFYRWNQFKVIPLACTLRTRNLPKFSAPRRRTRVDDIPHITVTQAVTIDRLLSHVTCPSWQKIEMQICANHLT